MFCGWNRTCASTWRQRRAISATGLLDLADHPTASKLFRLRAEHLLKNSPDIAQILWLRRQAAGHRRPADSSRRPKAKACLCRTVTAKAFELASRLGKLQYSEPFFPRKHRAFVALFVPIYRERQFAGMLAATYPLDTLLANQVPWWFTEKYKVEIVDDNDVRYATKTNVEGNSNLRHVIPFDPPGYAGCCCASPATARRTTPCNDCWWSPFSCWRPAFSGACGWFAT
jgi:two-component system sensor histidine kinase DctS